MNEHGVASASGRYRADIRRHGERGWQFAVLVYRPDLEAWWPLLRYQGVFPTREAAEAEALSVLGQMEQPPDVRPSDPASGRDRAIGMAVETAERIARLAGAPAGGEDEEGKPT